MKNFIVLCLLIGCSKASNRNIPNEKITDPIIKCEKQLQTWEIKAKFIATEGFAFAADLNGKEIYNSCNYAKTEKPYSAGLLDIEAASNSWMDGDLRLLMKANGWDLRLKTAEFAIFELDNCDDQNKIERISNAEQEIAISYEGNSSNCSGDLNLSITAQEKSKN